VPGAEAPVVGLYITYMRREDAERAMQAIDGAPSPSGGGEVMRASFGTAKYCVSFLRSVSCTNNNCLDAHEWGEPDDCFTREELATLYVFLFSYSHNLNGWSRKHTIKDTEKLKASSSKKVGSADGKYSTHPADFLYNPGL
jgi:CCR4-NOT transcription complex subunit 4